VSDAKDKAEPAPKKKDKAEPAPQKKDEERRDDHDKTKKEEERAQELEEEERARKLEEQAKKEQAEFQAKMEKLRNRKAEADKVLEDLVKDQLSKAIAKGKTDKKEDAVLSPPGGSALDDPLAEVKSPFKDCDGKPCDLAENFLSQCHSKFIDRRAAPLKAFKEQCEEKHGKGSSQCSTDIKKLHVAWKAPDVSSAVNKWCEDIYNKLADAPAARITDDLDEASSLTRAACKNAEERATQLRNAQHAAKRMGQDAAKSSTGFEAAKTQLKDRARARRLGGFGDPRGFQPGKELLRSADAVDAASASAAEVAESALKTMNALELAAKATENLAEAYCAVADAYGEAAKGKGNFPALAAAAANAEDRVKQALQETVDAEKSATEQQNKLQETAQAQNAEKDEMPTAARLAAVRKLEEMRAAEEAEDRAKKEEASKKKEGEAKKESLAKTRANAAKLDAAMEAREKRQEKESKAKKAAKVAAAKRAEEANRKRQIIEYLRKSLDAKPAPTPGGLAPGSQTVRMCGDRVCAYEEMQQEQCKAKFGDLTQEPVQGSWTQCDDHFANEPETLDDCDSHVAKLLAAREAQDGKAVDKWCADSYVFMCENLGVCSPPKDGLTSAVADCHAASYRAKKRSKESLKAADDAVAIAEDAVQSQELMKMTAARLNEAATAAWAQGPDGITASDKLRNAAIAAGACDKKAAHLATKAKELREAALSAAAASKRCAEAQESAGFEYGTASQNVDEGFARYAERIRKGEESVISICKVEHEASTHLQDLLKAVRDIQSKHDKCKKSLDEAIGRSPDAKVIADDAAADYSVALAKKNDEIAAEKAAREMRKRNAEEDARRRAKLAKEMQEEEARFAEAARYEADMAKRKKESEDKKKKESDLKKLRAWATNAARDTKPFVKSPLPMCDGKPCKHKGWFVDRCTYQFGPPEAGGANMAPIKYLEDRCFSRHLGSLKVCLGYVKRLEDLWYNSGNQNATKLMHSWCKDLYGWMCADIGKCTPTAEELEARAEEAEEHMKYHAKNGNDQTAAQYSKMRNVYQDVASEVGRGDFDNYGEGILDAKNAEGETWEAYWNEVDRPR